MKIVIFLKNGWKDFAFTVGCLPPWPLDANKKLLSCHLDIPNIYFPVLCYTVYLQYKYTIDCEYYYKINCPSN